MVHQTINPLLPFRLKVWGVHSLRVLLFVVILLLIHLDARDKRTSLLATGLSKEVIQEFHVLPQGCQIGSPIAETNLFPVSDRDGKIIQYLATTSPATDHIIGFSGPTNLLITLNADLQLTNLNVLWSRDTREHLAEVVKDESFWQQFIGLSWQELAEMQQVDAVSGATLTSFAIGESLVERFGGQVPALRFPEPLTTADLLSIFPSVNTLKPAGDLEGGWEIYDSEENLLGLVLNSSPIVDDVVGYQGPTETLIALGPDRKVLRIHVRNSFDNQPYVNYLNEDWSWPEIFKGRTLRELAQYDLEANGVEGVSGATFTSMAVARGVIQRAKLALEPSRKKSQVISAAWSLNTEDFGTLFMILCGLFLATTHLRGIGWLRVVYQLVLVGYVGFLQGDLLSQAMFVGWVQNGVPWRSAFRLVVLAGVAFTFPVFTKKNVYCSHLCAHGAVQQLVKGRLKFQLHPSRNLRRFLALIPAALLTWVVIVALVGLSFSLVDLEAFDAYLFRIAGTSAIAVAVSGVIASLFVPMAYCRFGCPTGALLEYFRRTRRSDRLSPADGIAVAIFALAVGLYWAC